MLTANRLAELRPFGFDLRHDLTTEDGTVISAWTTACYAAADTEDVRTASFEMAVLSGQHRGQTFRVNARAFNRALDR